MPKNIRVESHYHDDYLNFLALNHEYVDHQHYDTVIGGQPANALLPDGSPLLLYRPGAIEPVVIRRARGALRKAAKFSLHRGFTSGVVGHYDQPNCRMTAFTRDNLDEWGRSIPFIREVDEKFREELPSRYIAQRAVALQKPEWTIADTVFTTVTVNLWDATNSARTYVHQDDGDLKEGFGVIALLSSTGYKGAHLIFPKWRVAVDLRAGDLLLADVHQFHGNDALVPTAERFERISCVLYFRTGMLACD